MTWMMSYLALQQQQAVMVALSRRIKNPAIGGV
jgi:hypothetical protein